MKRIAIINILLSLMLGSCSLKKFNINDGIIVKLPTNAEVLSKDKLTGYLKSYNVFDRSFMVDNIFVSITSNTSQTMQSSSLENLKSSFTAGYQKFATIQSSDIQTYNQKQYFVLNYSYTSNGNLVNTYLFCNDSQHQNNHLAVGYIVYSKPTDQAEAQKLLKTILTNLEVK